MTELIQNILNIIEQNFDFSKNNESLDRFSFITQLRYLSYKVLNGIVIEQENDDVLFLITSKKEPRANQCVLEIRDYLLKEYDYQLSLEDEFYLVVHLSKLINEKRR